MNTKPIPLKVLEGNRGKRVLPENEPKPRPKAPECPDDIDDEARGVWKQLAPVLEKLGLLTETDGAGFAHLCQIRARIMAIHRFIRDNNASLVQEVHKPDPDGGMRCEYKPSPYVVMEKQYYQLFRLYASDYGLTPRGRVGLTVGVDKDDDGEDLLSK